MDRARSRVDEVTTRWTQQDVDRVMNKKPRSKYGAKKVLIDNITFDSKKEGARYTSLKAMQQAGVIGYLRCHPEYEIWIKGIFICKVILDFSYADSRRGHVFEDVKSTATNTALSKLKRRMVEAEYGITVDLV